MKLKSETMKYVYASLLLHAADRPLSEENLSHVLEAAGIQPDAQEIKVVVSFANHEALDQALRDATKVLQASNRKRQTRHQKAPPAR